ncbi:MAG: hypothetical protein A2Y12_01365 [Planctomycetes bacterium GWF2_42_9]|nr:MAG: hypothetical protein A2Y12_01365 [Planctomycetes bacterium GWF2_42_9]
MAGLAFDKTFVQFKEYFADRQAVISAVNKAILKKLNWIGGYVKTAAKHSIKKAGSYNAVSVAGKPPLSHVGLLKQHIYSAIEPQNDTVVVGPAKLNAKGTDVPSNLEFGGTAVMFTRRGRRKVKIKPRPYMRPALERSQGKIAQIWANSVKK